MIVYIDDNKKVLWTHQDNSVKEQFLDNDNCIVVEKEIEFEPIPEDNNLYAYYFNKETQEVYLECIGKKPKPPVTNEQIKEDTQSTKEVISLTSEDTLTTLEYLVTIEEKMDRILSILEK